MSFTRFPTLRFSLLVLVLTVAATAFAANVATMSTAGSQLNWVPSTGSYESIELIVSAPDGQIYTKRFNAQQSPSFSLSDLGNGLSDGVYNYELRFNPKVAASVAARLKTAREAGDDAAARKIMNEAGISGSVQSGTFSIRQGVLVSPDAVEQSTGGTRRITTNARPTTPVTNDQVIADDLIVQGSACVGLDCVNNESFGFDTIRLKENNTRIKFDDTSTSAGFSANDWQLTANDSASGGASKFSIEDITGSKVPFTVTGGAATNSIFVDSTGRVGFRTSTPVLDLHVATSNTPAIRLEQNNSGGFTAQTWDVAGNEANFFVRDVTGGSRLPFRIRPGAPTSSIDIAASGNVGVGTASPGAKLDIGTGSTARGGFTKLLIGNGGDTSQLEFFGTSKSAAISYNGTVLSIFTNGSSFVQALNIDNTGNVGIGTATPGSDLVVANGGTTSSVNAGDSQFTVASSRTFKENIEPFTTSNILEKIESVPVVTYDFKDNGPKDRLGLIAEDFHQIFGRGDDKHISGQEVQMALWLAVQQLTAQNKELQERLQTLESQLKQP